MFYLLYEKPRKLKAFQSHWKSVAVNESKKNHLASASGGRGFSNGYIGFFDASKTRWSRKTFISWPKNEQEPLAGAGGSSNL